MRKFYNIYQKGIEGISLKDIWAKAQAEGYDGLQAVVHAEFTKAEDSEDTNKFHAVFSSDNEDRHGDIVHQEFDLRAYKKNPVFLDSHNYDSIVHILGRVSKIKVDGNKLQGDIEFATDNPKGELARKLALKGFLNTTSIGFIPREFNDKGEILKSEMLEISAVSVPANADALFERSIEPTQTKENETTNEPASTEPSKTDDQITTEPSTTAPAETKSVDYRKLTLNAVKGMSTDRQNLLKGIAISVQKMKAENGQIRKRKIYSSIRKLLSEDIGR